MPPSAEAQAVNVRSICSSVCVAISMNRTMASAFGDGREAHRGGEHSILFQDVRDAINLRIIADEPRHDRTFASDLATWRAQALAQLLRVALNPPATPGFIGSGSQRLRDSGRNTGRQAAAEDVSAGGDAEVVLDSLVAARKVGA